MKSCYKKEFKIYSWASLDNNYGIYNWSFQLFPSISIEYWKYEKGGWWFCILFSWLLFGVTLDWRKDEKYDTF